MRVSDLELPVGIIQHIQSFLDGTEAAKTSILSKSWYEAWSTSPILVLDHLGCYNRQKRQSWNYVWKAMARYHQLNPQVTKAGSPDGIPAETSKYYDDDDDDGVNYNVRYDRLLANASKLGVAELDVDSPSGDFTPQVFSIKSLTKLSISSSWFDRLLDEFYAPGKGGLDDSIILCSSLASLRLNSISTDLDLRLLRDILLLCPFIENLDLSEFRQRGRSTMTEVKLICPRLMSLCLYKVHQDLADIIIENIHSDSPLVENLIFSGDTYSIVLPPKVLWVTSLTSLSACDCRVNLLGDLVYCSNLVSLRLEDVLIEDKVMRSILLGCPLIENLHLVAPTGLSGINVSEMHNLVSLFILMWESSSVEVSFTRGLDDVPEFKKLRSLSLGFVKLDDDFFDKFSTRFPCVEDLTLRFYDGYEDIRISSPSIKYLSLHHRGKLHKAEIDLPNIRKFVLNVKDVLPSLSFRWESQLKLLACSLSARPTLLVESSWFVKLREILKELRLSRISLSVKVYSQTIFWVKDLPSSPTPVVENLIIHHDDSSLLNKAYLCALFGCCRPTFITLNGYPRVSLTYNIAQTLHELFISQNTRCMNRLQNSLMYDLEEVDIELYKDLEWQTIPLTKFVEDAPVNPLDKEQVRFRFKWGAFKCT